MHEVGARMHSQQEAPGRLHDRPSLVVVALVMGAVMLAGCGGSPGSSESGDAGQVQSNEETTAVESESSAGGDGASDGVINVDGGYTQDEQLAELAAVVNVMREHFGRGAATVEGEPWSTELYSSEVAPRPEGDGVYRHRVSFDVAPEDLNEAYGTAEEIAEKLGLTENRGNSHGVTEHGEVFYGAGEAEDRTFIMAGGSAENFRAVYQTRHSDDPSLQRAYDRVVEKNSQEREGDHPLQTDDRTSVPGYEGE